MAPPPNNPIDDHGFDLRKVSWGYRRIFADAIRSLTDSGDIGEGREEVTRTFFEMLNRARPGSFDFALKEFLGALNPQTKWLLELPGVFDDFCTLGRELAEEKLGHGIAFFRLWGQGGFGDRPEHLRTLIRHVRALRAIDGELAQAFLAGYGRLLDELDERQIELFVGTLRDIHRRNPRTAVDFAALRLKSATALLRNLTQEARLEDLRDRLGRLARALSGRTIEVGDLSGLDSDALIERNASVVCFRDHLYLPRRIRWAPDRGANEALYLLATVVAAEAVRAGSFAAIQGTEGRSDLPEFLDANRALSGLVDIMEIVRIVENLRRRMPGARRLIDFGIRREFDLAPPRTATDAFLRRCLAGGAGPGEALAADLRSAAGRCADCSASVRLAGELLDRFAGIADADPRALTFFPDYYYPGGVSLAPTGTLVADLSRQPQPVGPPGDDEPAAPDGARRDEGDEQDASAVPAAFVYPEWNQNENDYYADWCFLREHRPEPDAHFPGLADPADEAAVRRARRMFERLRPDLARKEKFLDHGDEIDVDRLVEYLALRRRLPAPRVRFYQKTFIKQRDLAVALLVDVSGSTAGLPTEETPSSAPARRRIIDLEKSAARVLGEGLAALGDRFAIYGFSGNGREQCDFFIYKDLEEEFSDEIHRRLLAASPTASTRIGVALRHCRQKLAAAAARKKIIILITDGKPQDTGYDPGTRYAQYDVRMACQECARHDIHVVCVSTLENSRADLEIMFPHRRYAILEDMTRLADVLPRLYLKMTT